MAYKTIEISGPAGVQQLPRKTSHFYKGFSTVNNTDSGSRLYDFELIKQDLLNHFNTKKGERLMNPAFGSIIWDLLMEPLTHHVREALTSDINKICNSDPRITPTQMDITEYASGYILELTLVLNGTDQSSSMRLSFDQKVGLSVQ